MKLFSALVLLLFLSACGPEVIYEKEINISESGWTYTDTLLYQFEIADTSQLYNLFLQVRHSTDFGSQNLYVKIHTGFPDGRRSSQVLSIDMADKIGRWLGDCSGEKCTLDIPIQSRAYFNQLGIHSFTLEQHTRIDPLPEVLGARFKVEVAEQHKE